MTKMRALARRDQNQQGGLLGIDRFFEDFSPFRGTSFPPVDIQETDKNLLLNFDLPGVKKEDIKIEVDDDVLTVSGEKKEEEETDTKSSHRIERFYGSFERSFVLPRGVDPDTVKGDYENGVLRLEIPKSQVEKKPKTIEIGKKVA